MRVARERGAHVVALTNIMGSQATRDSDGVLYTRAGLEIGVAATKTHTAQVMALSLLALKLGRLKWALTSAGALDLADELRRLPDLVQQYLESPAPAAVMEIAAGYADRPFFLYLGRHVGVPVCFEGALKLKEISYIPTEAYPAGEMKHGPIALLEEGSPVVVVATDGHVFDKVVSNIQEVRARGARVIAVATEGNTRRLRRQERCIAGDLDVATPRRAALVISLLRETSAAALFSAGTACLRNSSRFPYMSRSMVVRPVTLPPGRARLCANPMPIGSGLTMVTIGIDEVASFAAMASRVPVTTMTSTGRRTRSAT